MMLKRRLIAVLLPVFLMALAPAPLAPSLAQDNAPVADGVPAPVPAPSPPPAPVAQPEAAAKPQQRLSAWKAEIDQITAAAGRATLSDRDLEGLRARAEKLRSDAAALIEELQPRLAAIQARVRQLSPGAKTDGAKGDPVKPVDAAAPAPETDALKADRKEQETAAAELDGYIKQAAVLQLQADEVIKAIGDTRRERFTRTLFAKTSSLFDPALWYEAMAAVPRLFNSFMLLLHDWMGLLQMRATDSGWAVIAMAVAVFGLLVRPVRTRFVHATERDTGTIHPPALRKALAAIAIVGVNVGLPVIGLLVISVTLRVLELSPERIERIFAVLMQATVASVGLWALSLAILAPSKPQWRMGHFSDATSAVLMRWMALLAVFYGLGTFVVEMTSILFAPVALTVAVTGVTALVDVTMLMLILRTVAGAIGAETEADTAPPPEDTQPSSVLWRWLLPLAWIASFAVIASAAFGYVALARFIVTEMVWAGAVFAILFILLILVDEAISAMVLPGTPFSENLVRSMGLSRSTVEQLGVVLSGCLRIALIIIAFLFILNPLGISSDDLKEYAREAFFGVKIGGLTISLSSILVGLAIFLAGLGVTHASQRWLEDRFLPRTQMDAGLKNSIRTAFGYAGFVIAAMIGFSSAGIGLDNIAIVAGALSVGIGFGLQSIVNNFVSGLILLVERPIKTGDVVEVGAEKGVVRKINVRSTEIETFDRASLIVPNSSLISGNVKNWMHRDPSGRCVVEIAVPYETDPQAVKDMLLDCAGRHRLALLFPAPAALLTGFTENAMKFKLICTVANVNDAGGVESDLRFAIWKKLREMGIEMAQQRSIVQIDQLEDLRDIAAALVAREQGTGKPASQT